jgi:hypothetical protein
MQQWVLNGQEKDGNKCSKNYIQKKKITHGNAAEIQICMSHQK